MSDLHVIPVPKDSDSKEVRWALETASSLWASDAREALRWLRRAAESASDSGDDLRSVQLASAAADLRNEASISGSMPPAASAPPPPGINGRPIGAALEPAGNETLPETPAAVLAGANNKQGAEASDSNGASQAVAPVAQAMQEMSATETPLGGVVPSEATADAATEQAAPEASTPEASTAEEPVAPVAATATPIAVGVTPVAVSSETPTATATPAARANSGNSSPPPAVVPTEESAAAAPPALPDVVPVAPMVQAKEASAEAAPVEEPEAAPPADNGAAAAEPAAAAPAAEAKQPSAPELSAAAPAAVPAAQPSGPKLLEHSAVRVAISQAPAANGLYQLHPLSEGETVPEDWSEAVLVGLSSQQKLFEAKK